MQTVETKKQKEAQPDARAMSRYLAQRAIETIGEAYALLVLDPNDKMFLITNHVPFTPGPSGQHTYNVNMNALRACNC